MSLTFDNSLIDQLVHQDRAGEVLETLDDLFRTGRLPPDRILQFAVAAMLSPWYDIEYSGQLLMEASRVPSLRLEAAVWQAYLNLTQSLDDTSLREVLENGSSRSAEASYMLARLHLFEGEVSDAKRRIEQSLAILRFPANLHFAIVGGFVSSQLRTASAKEAIQLVQNNHCEELCERSLEEKYRYCWAERIKGEIMTTPAWEYWIRPLEGYLIL